MDNIISNSNIKHNLKNFQDFYIDTKIEKIKKCINLYKLPIDIQKCNNQYKAIIPTNVYPPY